MNRTQNYQLCQWEKTDRIQMEDFNGDNGKLEAALAAVNERVDAVDAAVALTGNCRIEYSTYQGNGTYGENNPSTLTFEKPPLVAVIVSFEGETLFIHNGVYEVSVNGSNVYFTWNGNTVSWYTNASAVTQFNAADTYRVFTVYAKV